MRFIIVTLAMVFMYVHQGFARTDYQSDLIGITKSIKSMERRDIEIQKILSTLEHNKNNLSQNIFETRYRAVQNLHVYHSMQKSNPLFDFIASKKPFYDRYFEQRYQQNINAILKHSMQTTVSDFIELETKMADIERYNNEKKQLDKTLKSAISHLETLKSNTIRDTELDSMIAEIREQSLSISDFITKILNLTPIPPYVPQTTDSNFILPLAGIVKRDMSGTYIETNNQTLVTAPSDGRILFADDYKKLGHIIITDHGHGYISVLRGLSKTLVHAGEITIQGDAIALVGEHDSRIENGGIKTNKAMLYYELRYNGKIVNPIEHLSGP